MNKPQRLEQTIAALLIAGMAISAWFPLIAQLGRQPYMQWALIPFSLTMSVIAMALIYDAAERLLGKGRGIYAAAVFCTIPAVGRAASDPAALPTAALLFFSAAAMFLASRARGEERRAFVAMLAILMLAAGAFFGTIATVWMFFVAVILAVGDLEKRAARLRSALIPFLGIFAGAFLRDVLSLPLPRFALPENTVTLTSAFTLLPWTLWILTPLTFARSWFPKSLRWLRAAVIVPVLAIVYALVFGDDLITISVALAPALAFLAAKLLHDDLAGERVERRHSAVLPPALLTAAALLIVAYLSLSGVIAKPVLGTGHVVTAIMLAAALTWTVLSRLDRWAFFLLAIAGVFAGLLMTQREPLFPTPEFAAAPVSLNFAVLVFAACLAAAMTASLIKRQYFPAKTQQPDQTYRFAGENFVRFAGSTSPISVSVAANVPPPFTFAVFGDVVGAESLFATRRGGYLMFRALASALNEAKPAFAVSLGDLAREASPYAYARLRRLLRRLSVPLVVTPGNHDVFLGTQYNAEHFHKLFGADNGVFEIGNLRLVVLNNAWGFVGEPQFEWLERVLSEPKPLTFVFCHKPVFELRDGLFYAMETREHADRLHDLFRTRGVTAVFSGHIHSLLHEQRDGVTYLISGGGGSKLTTADDHYHFILADADSNGVTVRALPLPYSRTGKTTPLLELHFGVRL